MSPSGQNSEISISVGLDLQEAYDQARAMADVFRSQLFALEKEPPEVRCPDCGESLADQLKVSVDVTDARRKAAALAEAWDAAAEALERSGFVCLHPEPRRVNVDETMDICLDCERAVSPRGAHG